MLSPRQRTIVRMMAAGQRPAAIARELGCSVHTVRTHIRQARSRAGDADTLALVASVARGDHD